jgi:hypothetical protein
MHRSGKTSFSAQWSLGAHLMRFISNIEDREFGGEVEFNFE